MSTIQPAQSDPSAPFDGVLPGHPAPFYLNNGDSVVGWITGSKAAQDHLLR